MKSYGTIRLIQNTANQNVFMIKTEPHVLIRMKRVFPKIDNSAHGKNVFLSYTPETCRDLEWFCSRYPHDYDTTTKAALDSGARRHQDTVLRLEEIIGGKYDALKFKMAVKPRSYQSREAQILLTNGFLLIADDVGLGKTCAAICTMTEQRTLPALVVTLTHLPWQWKDEVAKFVPELSVHVIKKATPYVLPRFFNRGPDVLIISYSKLSGWADTLAAYCKSVVFDEIQELRHKRNGSVFSAKYAAAETIAGACNFRLGLSATPIYNYGGEMFNVLEVLKPGVLGTYEEFTSEWCSGSDERGLKIKDPKAFGTYCRDSFIMIRHTREQVGRELPPVIRIPQRIGSDREALNAVENSAAELAKIILQQGESKRGEKMQASEALSNMLRQATGIAKAPYVSDFVRLLVESGERVVLCGWHREVYSIWNSKLKDLKPIMYTGTETPIQKLAAKKNFTDGTSQILILSLRSGAGLDGLQDVASSIVFGELDWSPAVHEQCIGRLHRDGQGKSVAAYFLLAEDGADPIIAETLGLKREQIEGIRNPEGELLEKLDNSGERIRKLAELYVNRTGKSVPALLRKDAEV